MCVIDPRSSKAIYHSTTLTSVTQRRIPMKKTNYLSASIALLFTIYFGSQSLGPSRAASADPAYPVKITFFYDTNLNGTRDAGEPILTDIEVTASCDYLRDAKSSISVPGNQTITLRVSGKSPVGKPLLNCTYREPHAVVLLPEFSYAVGNRDKALGLADGFMTSPIRPGEMKMNDYNSALANPKSWGINARKYYPAGWSYPKNYFYYGYKIPSGGLKGTPHLAFDIWAAPGTPVLAGAPGIIVAPQYDWRFGISGEYGTVYYNHIVPAVSIGDTVKRYDVVGYIAEGQGDHVHLELRPDPERIISVFPGVRKEYFIKSPLKGEPVPIPPFFGR